MPKFIYVFNVEDKNKMLKFGYDIVKDDTKSNVYVFLARENFQFDLIDVAYVESDTLTF